MVGSSIRQQIKELNVKCLWDTQEELSGGQFNISLRRIRKQSVPGRAIGEIAADLGRN